ncbi:hypothetical protein ACFWDF_29130 [Streptomyces diastaticus]|uniref:hypothetical protein n=1 Tax=Streptomyces diastaticus TaxID=1956 RepID=UPI0036AA7B53
MSTATPGRRRRRLGISTKATEPDAPTTGPATETDTPTADPATEGTADAAEEVADAPAGTALADIAPAQPQSSTPPPSAEGGDQEADLLSNFGGGLPAAVDPFAPQLVDRSRLPEAPEERLAVYEKAIETSRGTLAASVTRARFRAEIEIGFVLDAIRSEPELYVPQYGTIENYGDTRWGYKRSTLYELMDTAPIRLAAAAGRVVSENPDTKGRKALRAPTPRPALESAQPETTVEGTPDEAPDAPATPRAVKVELPKSAALELVPVWRDQGEEVGLAILAEADGEAQESGRKLTAALVRKVVKNWGAEVEDQGGRGELLPSEKEQREAVSRALAQAAATVNKLVATLGKLDMESVPPLDHAEAERHAKAIRAGGRWLNGHVKVPEEVVEAELVQD